MSLIKIFMFIWPFIKEMVLGDRSVRETARDNKLKVLLAFVLAASLVMNIFSVNRLWTLSQQYLDLRKEYAFLDGKYKKLVSGESIPKALPAQLPVRQKVEEQPAPVLKKNKKQKGKKAADAEPSVEEESDKVHAERIRKLKEDFEKIKMREEGHNKTLARS